MRADKFLPIGTCVRIIGKKTKGIVVAHQKSNFNVEKDPKKYVFDARTNLMLIETKHDLQWRDIYELDVIKDDIELILTYKGTR